MLYPRHFTQLVGFDKIKEEVQKRCLSEEGHSQAETLTFSSNQCLIEKQLEQTFEFKQILELGYTFPIQSFENINATLNKARVTGGFVEIDELFALKKFIEIYDKSWSFIKTFIDFELPELNTLIPSVAVNPNLFKKLHHTFDPNGDINSNASSELRSIRQEKLAKESSLRGKITSLHEDYTSQGFIADDMAPTIRNGRAVVPVKAEYKRTVKGMIHDESSTGQTTYIEPEQVVNINNDLTELYYKERREIMRILTETTDMIRQNTQALRHASVFLVQLDLIRAKAKLAIDLKANKPKISKAQEIEIKEAKHPFLSLSQGEKIIANNFSFDPKNRILLISGPNAGGKSVALKTVALLQIMMQSGLLIPVNEESSLGIFEKMFADIGDQQSLEDDLSTYSAHLTNMNYFLHNADAKTFLFMDEFGTGTEPEYGGAIAETILEQLVATGSFGFITTHYANLKVYAKNTNGIQNGAMLYNIESLRPLYQLSIGEPGRSYALEIAQSIGLREDIINNAQSKIGGSHITFDALVREVELEKLKLKKLTNSLEEKETNLKQRIEHLEGEKVKLKTDRKAIIEDAKAAGRNIIEGSNRLIEKTVKEIKEQKAEAEAIKRAKSKIGHQKKLLVDKRKVPQNKTSVKLRVGDFVRMKGMSSTAEIVTIDGNKVEVSAGILKMNVKLNQLEKVGEKPKQSVRGSNIAQKLINKRSTFSPNIDIRGLRTEEALTEVTNFVDEAIILGVSELQVLHGKGNGILRDMIRQHLKGIKSIEKMEDAHIDRGGAGITIIHLS